MNLLFSLAVMDTLVLTGFWNPMWVRGNSSGWLFFHCSVFRHAVLASPGQGDSAEALPPGPVPLGLVHSAYSQGELFACRDTLSERAILVATRGDSVNFVLEISPGDTLLTPDRSRAYLFDGRDPSEIAMWHLVKGKIELKRTWNVWIGRLRVEMEKAQAKAEYDPDLPPLVLEGDFVIPVR